MNSEAIPNFPRRWRFGPVGGRGSVALAADAADTAGGAVESSSNDWGFLMELDLAVCQNLVPLVNIKIAGKWMFIPLKMVLIGIDPYPLH